MHVLALLYRSLIPSLLALTLVAPVAGGSVPTAVAADLVVGATLDIVALPVQVGVGQDGPFADAVSGQLLRAGDVVRTGAGGVALLTFFDGSESQLGSDSQVQVQRADYQPAPRIALFQSSGVTVNRVIPLPPGGSFETDTPTAIGLVRGTSYVVTVSAPVVSTTAANLQPRVVVPTPPTLSDDSLPTADPVASAVTGDDQVAAAIAPADGTDAFSSIVLLTDRDGHVGHVQFVTVGSSATTLELVQAGDLGTTAGKKATAAHLAATDLSSLEHAAGNLHDLDLAREAASDARGIAARFVPTETGAPAGQIPNNNVVSAPVVSTPPSAVESSPSSPSSSAEPKTEAKPARTTAATVSASAPARAPQTSAASVSAPAPAQSPAATNSAPAAATNSASAAAPIKPVTVSVPTLVQSSRGDDNAKTSNKGKGD